MRSAIPAWGFVLAGGLLAAFLDIVYAWLFWSIKAGATFTQILQSVTAGLVGQASFEGGAATAVLGLTLHCLIATCMAATYYMAARRHPLLVRRPLLFGSAYGLVLYVIMNHLVVPLSAASPGSDDRLWVMLTITVHVVFIGIPIALAARQGLRSD